MELEEQKFLLEKHKTAWEKLEEWLNKMEKRPLTLVNNVPGGSEASSVVFGEFTIFKIPTFSGTGSWEPYHKQFEAKISWRE